MTQTHTSYEFSERLKKFMGDSAPEPMGHDKYQDEYENNDTGRRELYPMYELCDLLSKPFCEALALKGKEYIGGQKYSSSDYGRHIYFYYWRGGLPAVEKCLMDIMEAK